MSYRPTLEDLQNLGEDLDSKGMTRAARENVENILKDRYLLPDESNTELFGSIEPGGVLGIDWGVDWNEARAMPINRRSFTNNNIKEYCNYLTIKYPIQKKIGIHYILHFCLYGTDWNNLNFEVSYRDNLGYIYKDVFPFTNEREYISVVREIKDRLKLWKRCKDCEHYGNYFRGGGHNPRICKVGCKLQKKGVDKLKLRDCKLYEMNEETITDISGITKMLDEDQMGYKFWIQQWKSCIYKDENDYCSEINQITNPMLCFACIQSIEGITEIKLNNGFKILR